MEKDAIFVKGENPRPILIPKNQDCQTVSKKSPKSIFFGEIPPKFLPF
jgi:hypothetical protein